MSGPPPPPPFRVERLAVGDGHDARDRAMAAAMTKAVAQAMAQAVAHLPPG